MTDSPAVPSAEAVELLMEEAVISDLSWCASAGLDAVVVDWDRFKSFDAVPESDTYEVEGDVAKMVFGLVLKPAAGMPTLATVIVSAVMIGTEAVLLGVDARAPAADDAPALAEDDTRGLPDWPTPLPGVLAKGLHEILEACEAGDDPAATLRAIREIATRSLAFDPERMRLRIDDQHGNRSFIQLIDGRWKAFRNDGREVLFTYCFGHVSDEDAIARDLSAATTIHDIRRAAMSHVRGLQEVQVEVTWERHRWTGDHFAHVPRP